MKIKIDNQGKLIVRRGEKFIGVICFHKTQACSHHCACFVEKIEENKVTIELCENVKHICSKEEFLDERQ
jgi:hypothetical protein